MFFSYASDELDFDIKWGRPSKRQIEQCMEELWARINDCREQWWNTFSTVCLENKLVAVENRLIKEQNKPTRSAAAVFKVKSARYETAARSIRFTAHGSSAKHSGKCP